MKQYNKNKDDNEIIPEINDAPSVDLAENRLLNAIWLNPNLMDDANYNSDLFMHDEYKSIAKTLDNMTRNSVPLNGLSLYNETSKVSMGVTQDMINKFINLNSSPVETIKDITDFLKSVKKSMKGIGHIDNIRGILSKNVTLTEDVTKNLRDEFDAAEEAVLSKDSDITKIMNLKEWGEQWVENYKERKNGKKYYFNEPVLDRIIVDGPIPGAGTLLAASSGMGKSTAILKLANCLINAGIPTGLFTLEMGAVSTYDRLLSTRTQIPYSEIVNPPDEETYSTIYKRWQDEKAKLDMNRNFFISENADVSINDIRRAVLKFQEKIGQKYCIIIIDLITMLKDLCEIKNGQNLSTTIELGMNKMNALAKELGFHYVGTAQLNRSGETTTISDIEDIDRFRPTRAQIKNSSSLLERPRATVSLFRKKYFADMYLPDDPETQIMQDTVELQLLKQNNGECKREYELFDGETFSMTPIEEEKEQDDE